MGKKERALFVLASQGKAQVILSTLDDEQISILAGYCMPDGKLVEGIREKFIRWLAGYYDSQKATVDEQPIVTTREA